MQTTDTNILESQRNAWNRAFSELELGWQWDAGTWERLQKIEGEKEQLCAFVRSQHGHLLQAYDTEFLYAAVSLVKQQPLAA